MDYEKKIAEAEQAVDNALSILEESRAKVKAAMEARDRLTEEYLDYLRTRKA